MRRARRVALAVLAGFCLSLIAIGFVAGRASAQSGAHGDGHAQGHDVYRGWMKPGTAMSCCNGQKKDVQGNVVEGDCRPTRAYPDEFGQWRAWTGSYWILIPPAALLPTDVMGDGRSHLCEQHGTVHCFTPAPARS